MKGYKWKYMSEPMLDEMDELLKSEHGATLAIWSAECANAGAEGLTKGIIKGTLLGVGIGTVVGVGKIIVDKIKKKRVSRMGD